MRLKLNWGTGIVIAFVLFMGFILYFVFEVQSDAKYDNELVVKEYYKKDMRYGDEIQALQNASDLSEKPEIISAITGIALRFPESWQMDSIKGTVSLYRPSSSRMDFEMPLVLTDSQMLVPESFLARGQWQVMVKWRYEGKNYMIKKKIFRSK